VISVLLTVSLLAGGVANAVFASDNADAYDAIEPLCEQSDISLEIDLCNDFERLRDSEIAASVSYCIVMEPVHLP